MLTTGHATAEETAMRVADSIRCADLSCAGVGHTCLVPSHDVDPAAVSTLLISEATSADPADYYYAGPDALFARTTLLAFQEAGADVQTTQDILNLGVYLTTAVKCAKTTPRIERGTIEACSHLLEREIALFPNVKVYLLMGDVAISALSTIAKRAGDPRPSRPAPPTRSAAVSSSFGAPGCCPPTCRPVRSSLSRRASAS
jgi:uracil-DNA glycosylase